MQSVKNSNRNTGPQEKKLNTYSLAGLGVGGIIGSGFFLGSAISIRQAGPSVILSFLLSGLVVSQVLGAITSISINRPVTGSFKVYAEQFLGKYAGFTMGWVLYISNLLAIGSEAVAAGIFIRFWVPKVSVAVSAFSITVLVILINRLNTNQFSLVESGMAVLKISALLFFIIAAIRFIAANGIAVKSNPFSSLQAFLPNGISGFFQSMLIAVFSYAGISTVAMATAKVKKTGKRNPGRHHSDDGEYHPFLCGCNVPDHLYCELEGCQHRHLPACPGSFRNRSGMGVGNHQRRHFYRGCFRHAWNLFRERTDSAFAFRRRRSPESLWKSKPKGIFPERLAFDRTAVAFRGRSFFFAEFEAVQLSDFRLFLLFLFQLDD
ncbi:amino acid permease [Caproicibacter fermentans]|uniref:Amino acid permease n=1 Tax=Caproicibacter fermentans TaxID=2576756 RepID=A0A7G8TCG5_9FIRM|nr:amino acid permease [Caproicibacter fermentans]